MHFQLFCFIDRVDAACVAQPKINKILKTLEERLLVKSIKSVQNASRKESRCLCWATAGPLAGCKRVFALGFPLLRPLQVYMLYELEPAKELTGGPWYGPDAFDSEFIKVLQNVRYN